MSLHQARKPLSKTEIARVFEALELATQEQRDRFLLREFTAEPTKPTETCYVSRLSHGSEPVSTEGD